MKLGTESVMVLCIGLLTILLVSSSLVAPDQSNNQDPPSLCWSVMSLCPAMKESDSYIIYTCTTRCSKDFEQDLIPCPATIQPPFRSCILKPSLLKDCGKDTAMLNCQRGETCQQLCAGTTTQPPGNETKTIIGAVVGSVLGVIFIILLVLMICCLLKKRRARKETDEYQGCTVDQGGALPPAFSFDNPEYSQPPSGDSKKYEQLNPTTEIKKDANNYETLTHGDEYDNDIPSIVKSVGDAKSYDNMINKKDDMDEPKNNVSSPGNVHTDFMGNNSMIGEAGNKSDSSVRENDDTTLIDNSLYGSDKPAAVTIQGNDDTILVDNSLYGSGRD